jgi:hypothetical protein
MDDAAAKVESNMPLTVARNSPRSKGRDDSSIAHSITTRAA